MNKESKGEQIVENLLENAAEKVAKAICPHNNDTAQKGEIKAALIELVKAIIEETKEDYRKNYWPS